MCNGDHILIFMYDSKINVPCWPPPLPPNSIWKLLDQQNAKISCAKALPTSQSPSSFAKIADTWTCTLSASIIARKNPLHVQKLKCAIKTIHTLVVYVDSLKGGQNWGLIFLWESFFIKSESTHHTLKPILKVGWILGCPLSTCHNL